MTQESDLAFALRQLIDQQQKRLNELADREAEVFRREQTVTLREQKYQSGMKRLNEHLEKYFRAPSSR